MKLNDWFEENKNLLETAYLQRTHPWNKSGLSGDFERWENLRKPIADCMTHDGSFLDIGCANGFLLKCVVDWKKAEGIEIIAYGLDLSDKLLALAQTQLPDFKHHFFQGNALYWQTNLRFDYIRTELCYVPNTHHKALIDHLLVFLKKGGKLLLAEYISRNKAGQFHLSENYLAQLGYVVKTTRSGFQKDGKELTKICVLEQNS